MGESNLKRQEVEEETRQTGWNEVHVTINLIRELNTAHGAVSVYGEGRDACLTSAELSVLKVSRYVSVVHFVWVL